MPPLLDSDHFSSTCYRASAIEGEEYYLEISQVWVRHHPSGKLCHAASYRFRSRKSKDVNHVGRDPGQSKEALKVAGITTALERFPDVLRPRSGLAWGRLGAPLLRLRASNHNHNSPEQVPRDVQNTGTVRSVNRVCSGSQLRFERSKIDFATALAATQFIRRLDSSSVKLKAKRARPLAAPRRRLLWLMPRERSEKSGIRPCAILHGCRVANLTPTKVAVARPESCGSIPASLGKAGKVLAPAVGKSV